MASDIVTTCADFLDNQTTFAMVFYGIAIVAFVLAILFLMERARIALTKLEKAEKAIDAGQAAKPNALENKNIKEVAEAVTGMAKALKDAPASVILAVLGLTLIYIPSTNVGEPCDAILKTKVESELSGKEERQANFKALVDKKPATLEVTQQDGVITTSATWEQNAATEQSAGQ